MSYPDLTPHTVRLNHYTLKHLLQPLTARLNHYTLKHLESLHFEAPSAAPHCKEQLPLHESSPPKDRLLPHAPPPPPVSLPPTQRRQASANSFFRDSSSTYTFIEPQAQLLPLPWPLFAR
ncbi:hypothetical protein ACFE04_001688 [Oxalis oulophora]